MASFNPQFLISSVVKSSNPALSFDSGGKLVPVGTITPAQFGADWGELRDSEMLAYLLSLARRVCRINDKNGKHIGTGFIASNAPKPADGVVIITNLHVALNFSRRNGSNEFELLAGHEPHYSLDNDGVTTPRRITNVVYAPVNQSPRIDFALLFAEAPGLEITAPAYGHIKEGERVCAIGFPGVLDHHLSQNEGKVFGAEANLGKRLISPGTANLCSDGTSLRHYCSTLQGSSGSLLVSLETRNIVGLHFRGRESEADALGEGCSCSSKNHNSAVSVKTLSNFRDEISAFGISLPQSDASGPVAAQRIGAATGKVSVFGLAPDLPDFRDIYYEPPLKRLRQQHFPDRWPKQAHILKQDDANCTGYALAALINFLEADRHKADENTRQVSPQMLYTMARLHDEIPFEDTAGSTLRGVVKGFYHNGAAQRALAEKSGKFDLTPSVADDARETALGNYCRLRPDLNHYHAALADAKCVLVSAQIHEGWLSDNLIRGEDGSVDIGAGSSDRLLAHAFFILGYDESGFIVQNSWGKEWGGHLGRHGIARWRYSDWAANVIDAWVLRLAVRSSQAFGLSAVARARVQRLAAAGSSVPASSAILPRRADVMGHFMSLKNGELEASGRYASTVDEWKATAQLIAEKLVSGDASALKYPHTLIHFSSEWRSADELAEWTAAAKKVFRENGIYLICVGWEANMKTWVNTLVSQSLALLDSRLSKGNFFYAGSLEAMLREFGGPIWRDITHIQNLFANGTGEFSKALSGIADKSQKLHVIGHGFGASVAKSFLASKAMQKHLNKLGTCTLLNPYFDLDEQLSVLGPIRISVVRHAQTFKHGNAAGSAAIDWSKLASSADHALAVKKRTKVSPKKPAIAALPQPFDAAAAEALDCSSSLLSTVIGAILQAPAKVVFPQDQFDNLK